MIEASKILNVGIVKVTYGIATIRNNAIALAVPNATLIVTLGRLNKPYCFIKTHLPGTGPLDTPDTIPLYRKEKVPKFSLDGDTSDGKLALSQLLDGLNYSILNAKIAADVIKTLELKEFVNNSKHSLIPMEIILDRILPYLSNELQERVIKQHGRKVIG